MAKESSQHKGHRQRMRARVEQYGLESLEPHEALEYVLYITNTRKDTNGLAHVLMDRFGDFAGVLDASEEDLLTVEGVGPSTARMLHLLPQVGRYYTQCAVNGKKCMKTTDQLVEYLMAQFAGTVQERALLEQLTKIAPSYDQAEELLIRLINDNPDVKFVVAPHEMDESRIARLMAETKGGALRYTQCTPRTTYGSRQLLILDTVGILASVYGYATWSYIGGGFGVGIHNTLEAATFGLPVAFGPNYEKFKEARDLVTLGAARSVTDYEQLRTWFVPLRDNEEFLQKTSRIAKDYTTRHQGATGIIVKTIFH